MELHNITVDDVKYLKLVLVMKDRDEENEWIIVNTEDPNLESLSIDLIPTFSQSSLIENPHLYQLESEEIVIKKTYIPNYSLR